MDLWRLERLRLVRTNRLLILLGVYAFFGAIGPLTARYLEDILRRFGGADLTGLDLPAPTPPDGITQFTANASQLGLLTVVIVAAGALALDARPEWSVFLRTRARSSWRLLVPRFVTVTAAAGLALVTGTAIAAAITAVLLGELPWGALVVGTAYGVLYLAFTVALTAAMATVTRSVLTTVLVTLAILIGLPVLAILPPLRPWVPSELVGAVDVMIRGGPAGDHMRAALTTVVAGAVLLAVAARRMAAREL